MSPPLKSERPGEGAQRESAISETVNTALEEIKRIYPWISIETLNELHARGLLSVESPYWSFRDGSNGTTRRLDGKKFNRPDNKGPDWHKLIGLSDVLNHDRPRVIFILEGSKDALAAAEIAHQRGVLPETGILCALGSGYRPIKSELEQLRGRFVEIVGDRDSAGLATTKIVHDALTGAGIDCTVWEWDSMEGKDISELLENQNQDSKTPSKNFSCLSSLLHTVQPFNPSTSENGKEGISPEERIGIVYPFICTATGEGNSKSFLLGRATKHRKFNMKELRSIFDVWRAKSLPFLPPDSDADKDWDTFLRQITRVRFTDTGLQAACERALKAKPPFIAARDGDVEVEKTAALCRELQRDAGNRAFICPVSVVQAFLNLRWPSQANYLLHVLEDEKVLECVERGAPNTKGKKGKPTFWKYKLPMDGGGQ
jgi:Toprim-like